jgi:hypothetical protein
VAERPVALPPDLKKREGLLPSSHINVSSNAAARGWCWEVISDGRVIERGLAATEVLARADAIRAVLCKGDRWAEIYRPCLEDQSPRAKASGVNILAVPGLPKRVRLPMQPI